jgi:uncharacterized protein YecE (DUF72 family)
MGENRWTPEPIRVGPAGWSYVDWKGQVYPKPQPRGFDPLGYLAQYFDAIEINSTFYRIPDAKTTQRWVARVADHPDFRFTAKLWQGFTHEGTATAQDAAVFRQAMAPLQEAGRLGAVLMQFPYRFHHTAENQASVRRLAEAFRDYPLVLEIRHRSWDRAEVFAWLQALGIGFCNIDQPQVSYGIGLTRVVTSPVGYLRLHGRNAAMWFAEEGSAAARYDYRYSAEEPQELVDAVEVLSRRARETYLITNNHFRGQAALNALELRSHLRRSPVPVPPPLLAAYPELRQIAAAAPGAGILQLHESRAGEEYGERADHPG